MVDFAESDFSCPIQQTTHERMQTPMRIRKARKITKNMMSTIRTRNPKFSELL